MKWGKLLLIFILGSIGGLIIERAIVPLLVRYPPFNKIDFLQNISSGTTIINRTETLVIKEDDALRSAILKIESSIVLVKSKNILQSGFVFTRDGWILTASNDALLRDTYRTTILWQDKEWPVKLIKEETSANKKLTLLKIEADNMPVLNFGDNIPSLGEKVFLLAIETDVNNKINYFVNSGIVKKIDDTKIYTNIREPNKLMIGSPLVNIQGEVIGINYALENGEVISAPTNLVQ